jgi:hypothetical protein
MARVAERLSEQLERQLASHPLDVLEGFTGHKHRLVKPRVVLAETSPHSEMIQLDCVFPHPLIWHCSPRSWAGGSNSQFSKRRGFDVPRFQTHTVDRCRERSTGGSERSREAVELVAIPTQPRGSSECLQAASRREPDVDCNGELPFNQLHRRIPPSFDGML